MYINQQNYSLILEKTKSFGASLVAVSKIKPVEAILELYEMGHRDFGENYVQELVDKQSRLPHDIRWHYIGHLQSNKVKFISPFIHLIHGIDSIKLLKEVNKQAQRNNRVIDLLLQVHIAREETKYGFSMEELSNPGLLDAVKQATNIRVTGLMGMASFSDDKELVRSEFKALKVLFDQLSETRTENFQLSILSMGMSGDYELALEEGSTMIRIGSSIFGFRT